MNVLNKKNIIYVRRRWGRWYVWVDDSENENPIPTKYDWSFPRDEKNEALKKAFELKEQLSGIEFGPCCLSN